MDRPTHVSQPLSLVLRRLARLADGEEVRDRLAIGAERRDAMLTLEAEGMRTRLAADPTGEHGEAAGGGE